MNCEIGDFRVLDSVIAELGVGVSDPIEGLARAEVDCLGFALLAYTATPVNSHPFLIRRTILNTEPSEDPWFDSTHYMCIDTAGRRAAHMWAAPTFADLSGPRREDTNIDITTWGMLQKIQPYGPLRDAGSYLQEEGPHPYLRGVRSSVRLRKVSFTAALQAVNAGVSMNEVRAEILNKL